MSVIFTFAISCILFFAFTIKMPETFRVPPPEMIEELKYQYHEALAGERIKNY